MAGLCVSVCMLVCASLLVLFECISSLWGFLLPQWFHLCMYEFVVYVWLCVQSFVCRPGFRMAVQARVLWSPWLVGDVGIRGRLKWWLHNVFALMIPTVCSSYQLCCTGFHIYRWYEITHRLLPYLWPSVSLNTNHHTSQNQGKQSLWGERKARERKRVMDM